MASCRCEGWKGRGHLCRMGMGGMAGSFGDHVHVSSVFGYDQSGLARVIRQAPGLPCPTSLFYGIVYVPRGRLRPDREHQAGLWQRHVRAGCQGLLLFLRANGSELQLRPAVPHCPM